MSLSTSKATLPFSVSRTFRCSSFLASLASFLVIELIGWSKRVLTVVLTPRGHGGSFVMIICWILNSRSAKHPPSWALFKYRANLGSQPDGLNAGSWSLISTLRNIGLISTWIPAQSLGQGQNPNLPRTNARIYCSPRPRTSSKNFT